MRTLIVDDSALFRRSVAQALEGLAGVEVVGSASSGRGALARLRSLDVDLLVLDVNMPDMDGLETLRAVREQHPRVRVVMLSGHSRLAAQNTVKALCLGAEDFITKPSGGDHDNLARLRDRLRRSLLREGPAPGGAPPPVPTAPSCPRPARRPGQFHDCLAIGSSTGGPRALSYLFSQLPPLNCPILLVQHMPALFTRSLAEQLSAHGRIPCQEARDGQPVERGVALLAPGGLHMEVVPTPRGRVIRLHDEAPVNHCRPSVDLLFRSAAQAYGPRCLGLVLTGMGSDGLEGSRALVAAGSEVLVQSREGCVVWGMPRAVSEAGLASASLPLEELPRALLERLRVLSPAT